MSPKVGRLTVASLVGYHSVDSENIVSYSLCQEICWPFDQQYTTSPSYRTLLDQLLWGVFPHQVVLLDNRHRRTERQSWVEFRGVLFPTRSRIHTHIRSEYTLLSVIHDSYSERTRKYKTNSERSILGECVVYEERKKGSYRILISLYSFSSFYSIGCSFFISQNPFRWSQVRI